MTTVILSRNEQLCFDIANKVYHIFQIKFHYSSTVRFWRSKQYYTADSRLLPVETMPHPTTPESETTKIVFLLSQHLQHKLLGILYFLIR